MPSDAALQTLLDKQAIAELSYRYSRACDRLDRALLESAYWPDGTDDHGTFKGTAPDYVDWVMGFLAGWVSSHHDNTNILIEVDGDRAWGEVHWTGYYRYDRDGETYDHLAVGRYIDRYERRGGEWRILHRTCVSDWTRIAPTLNDWRQAPPGAQILGRRDRDDPVYQGYGIDIARAAD